MNWIELQRQVVLHKEQNLGCSKINGEAISPMSLRDMVFVAFVQGHSEISYCSDKSEEE